MFYTKIRLPIVRRTPNPAAMVFGGAASRINPGVCPLGTAGRLSLLKSRPSLALTPKRSDPSSPEPDRERYPALCSKERVEYDMVFISGDAN